MALMSMYTSGRDPVNFTQPQAFAPERWLRDGNDSEMKTLKPHGSMPFAIGARSCVGKKIATYEIHCLITKVIMKKLVRSRLKIGLLQLLQQFSLKSLNTGDVNFKLELIGVPDKKILIAFRSLTP
jgi:ecdysteroid 2-hydroxylase